MMEKKVLCGVSTEEGAAIVDWGVGSLSGLV